MESTDVSRLWRHIAGPLRSALTQISMRIDELPESRKHQQPSRIRAFASWRSPLSCLTMRSICSLLPSWPATALPTRTSGCLSSIVESNARECKQSMLEPRLRRRCPRLWDPNPSVLIAGPVLGILLNDLLQLLLQGSFFIPRRCL